MNMNITQSHGLEGYYTVRRVSALTGETIQEIGPFKNAITNIGLEQIGDSVAIYYAYIGSGTAAGANNNTQMGNYIASTTSVIDSTTNRTLSSPYWVERSTTFRFDPQGVDTNITEVGVGWTSDSVGGLWSRALTVDGVGTPITITLLADEYLDVTYTLRLYPELGDQSYSVNISGTSHTFTARQANVTSAAVVNPQQSMGGTMSVYGYGGPVTLGSVIESIQNATEGGGLANPSTNAYVPGSKKLTFTLTVLPPDGNFTGGISGLEIYGLSNQILNTSTQIRIVPPIPKDNTKTMSLSFEYTWNRV